MSITAKAPAGKQMMISSVFERFCAECGKDTTHEFLIETLVQCKECFRSTHLSKEMIKGKVL